MTEGKPMNNMISRQCRFRQDANVRPTSTSRPRQGAGNECVNSRLSDSPARRLFIARRTLKIHRLSGKRRYIGLSLRRASHYVWNELMMPTRLTNGEVTSPFVSF